MKAKILMIAMFILIVSSCSKDEVPKPGTNEVFMSGNMFSPVSLTVTKGSTVTWTNKESVIHTVTSDNNIFNSGDMGNSKTFSFTFSTAGNFPYHCIHHSGMNGTVSVQ